MNLKFSIIIPAHNEAKIIKNTIDKLKKLDYDNYEIIVVENGSSDGTYEIVKKSGVKIYRSKKGVSNARNYGFKKSDPETDWVIFLDADVILEKNFLKALSKQLKNKVIGTCSQNPDSNKIKYKLIFKIHNLINNITKSPWAIIFVNKKIGDKIKFDNELICGEDTKYVKDARKYGSFLFFKTKHIKTSVRRFEKEGWLKVAWKWSKSAIKPSKKIKYKVVR